MSKLNLWVVSHGYQKLSCGIVEIRHQAVDRVSYQDDAPGHQHYASLP